MIDRLQSIRAQLAEHGQEHLLAFYDEMSAPQRQSLLNQIDELDLDLMSELIESYVRSRPDAAIPADLQPANCYPADAADSYDANAYREAGRELVRAGSVAAFTVAGGQGTRLGWRGPKGTYPATAVTGKPLFRVFAEQIQAAEQRYHITIPWYIMTSPQNDQDTRSFFADNNCFGLKRSNIFMFPQGTIPSLDAQTGRILLADKATIATNPDGHGGSIKALHDSGALEDMHGRGIEHISYFQVDNPLVNVIDPLFIGLHATAPNSSREISSKMVAKTSPQEKVGVFCRSHGKTVVIEYSDLPQHLATARDDEGSLRFNAGSVAIHLFSVDFVQRLTGADAAYSLPYHRADKKAPHVDLVTGEIVEPSEPNAVKLEMFVFDALEFAESSIVLETRREDEFAPIKNAQGVDSASSSQQLQSDRAGRWLESQGVKVPRRADGSVDAEIEISSLTAMEPADLRRLDLPVSIAAGSEVVL